MGIIFLLILGLNILGILIINFFCYWVLNQSRIYLFKTKNIFQLPTLFLTIPIFIISISGSFYIFYQYFYAGSVGIGMAFFAPIIKNEIELGNLGAGKIVLREEINRATGARGGLDIVPRLFYVIFDSEKEIEIHQYPIYKNPEIYISLRKNDQYYLNGLRKPDSDYNIFIDPNKFTFAEYSSIINFLEKNIEAIDLALRNDRYYSYKKLNSYFAGTKLRIKNSVKPFPNFDNVYYCNKDSLNRTYICSNSEIKINYHGSAEIIFKNQVKRKNGTILKSYPLGVLTDNGKHILVKDTIENFKLENNKMYLFDSVVESCHDQSNFDLFSEYTFSQIVVEKHNLN